MSSVDRGGLKAAFANFRKPEAEREAEVRLLGRTVEPADSPDGATQVLPDSYVMDSPQRAAGELAATASRLQPRPLLQREAVRQLSFRCPVSLTAELRRKAAFNQLEQQEIIIEGLRRVLAELPQPPEGWDLL